MAGKATPKATRFLSSLERVFLITGITLLVVYFGVRVYGFVASRAAVATFRHAPAEDDTAPSSGSSGASVSVAGLDTSLWSDKRIRAYKESLSHTFGTPLAVLEIPKLHLEVPVFDGTDDVTLDRGVGRIVGTARPGKPGNIGIAGHRDGFFRGLKDIAEGDEIKLVLQDAVSTYVVDQITIVKPEDVSVLQPRPVPSITLVTCFPFYFVGSAPERYIVSASLRAEPKPAVGNARPNP
jgi:sortase A